MKTEFERFITKVNKTESCWLWTGSTLRGNYGHFRRRKPDGTWTMGKAHRFSYEYFKHPIPKGQQVCHHCDNPLCVNPDHLFTGTALDNNRDCLQKNRHAFGRDPNHKLLSQEIAVKLRDTKLKNPNLTYKELGSIFNTSASQAHRIVSNQIWKPKEN